MTDEHTESCGRRHTDEAWDMLVRNVADTRQDIAHTRNEIAETRTKMEELLRLINALTLAVSVHVAECGICRQLVSTHDILLKGPPGDTEGKGGLVGQGRLIRITAAVAWTALTGLVGGGFWMALELWKARIIGGP